MILEAFSRCLRCKRSPYNSWLSWYLSIQYWSGPTPVWFPQQQELSTWCLSLRSKLLIWTGNRIFKQQHVGQRKFGTLQLQHILFTGQATHKYGKKDGCVAEIYIVSSAKGDVNHEDKGPNFLNHALINADNGILSEYGGVGPDVSAGPHVLGLNFAL